MPGGSAVAASPALWIRSASSATLPEAAKTATWAAAVSARTTSASATVRTPCRDRLIESSTRPCEWPCACALKPPAPPGRAARARRARRPAEQLGDVVVVELVDDLTTRAPARHEPEVAQQPKLVRDRRALHRDRDRDLVHRRRARVQAGEDAQPARGRQRLDAVGRHLREAVVAQ